MVTEPGQNEMITRYLLDQLSEAEREQVIDRYLSDSEFFEQVLAVEEELIDDYARDQLPPPARARFERSFLTTPERRDRVKHARAFNRALAQKGAAPGWRSRLGFFGSPRPALSYVLAAAAALMFLGTAWLAVETVRLRRGVGQPAAGQAPSEHRIEELSSQVAAERERAVQLADELQRLRAQAEAERASWQKQERELQRRAGQSRSPREGVAGGGKTGNLVASFELPAGEMIVRGPGQSRTLAIKAGADLVRLQLNLVRDDYLSYRVTLRTFGGDEVVAQEGLKAQTTRSGRAVVLSFPTGQVVTGDYIVTLSGVTEAGGVKELNQWPVRIERK